MKYRAVFYTRHEKKGASSRYRSIQYFDFLRESGITIVHRPLFSDRYLTDKYQGKSIVHLVVYAYLKRLLSLVFELPFYKYVLVEKELFPYLPSWPDRFICLAKSRVIYDFDDAIWMNYKGHANRFLRLLLSQKIEVIMRSASLVCCGSHYILEFAAAVGAKRTEFLPTVLCEGRYHGQKLSSHVSSIKPSIVWIGSPSTSNYIKRLFPVFKQLNKQYGVVVKVIGSNFARQAQEDFLEIIEWSSETEIEEMLACDIGVMPLPSDEFEKGKCAFKLIQYMGLALPVVASPVGENVYVVEEGVSGLLATDYSEWYESLELLICDDRLRNEFGAAGYKRFLASYTLDSVKQQYISFFRDRAL